MKKLSWLLLFYVTYSFADPIDNTLSYKRIGDIAISPDSQQVAFTVSQIQANHLIKQRYYSLYISDSENHLTQLQIGEYLSQPIWSPDGKILSYLIKNGEQQSINLYDLSTKKSSNFVTLKNRNIAAYKWSPNGNNIAFVADDDKTQTPDKPVNINQDFINSRIYVKSVVVQETPTALTSEKISISPGFSATLDGGLDWSVDGKSIAFAHQPSSLASESPNTSISILTVANKAVSDIPLMKTHTANQPHFSPDGKWLAYAANTPITQDDKKRFYSNIRFGNQICVSNTQNFAATCLPNTFNGSPAIIGWSAASDAIYVLDWYKTAGAQIYALNINPKIPAKLISNVEGFIEPLTLALNATHTDFAFGFETIDHSPEIYKSKVSPFKLEQVTHFQNTTAEKLGQMKTIQWKSNDGLTIEGILITPANYDPNKKYPLLVDVHGGPTGAWAKRYIGGCDEYGDMIIPVCVKDVLDLGYVVFQPNYRGSSGYGTKFRAANVGDLGGGDYQDIMSGVDYLIANGIVDPSHMAIYGWSYGGYMTSWAITQTNRFKVAISGAGLTDFVSFTGTTDIPFYLQTYLAADLWDNKQLYLQRSPIFFSKNIVTPLLILHGKNDPRVPLSQAYELYHSLKLQNKPVEMIVYPDTGHVLTDANMIDAANRITNTWLKKALE